MTDTQKRHLWNGRWNLFASGLGVGLALMNALLGNKSFIFNIIIAIFNYYVSVYSFEAALKEDE